MTRLHGDVSKEDLELEKDLQEMEDYFNKNINKYHPADIAKGFVCLSHDYFVIGDDDKGSELLEKASKICPSYFEKEIKDDIKTDAMFEVLVGSLTSQILAVARGVVESLG